MPAKVKTIPSNQLKGGDFDVVTDLTKLAMQKTQEACNHAADKICMVVPDHNMQLSGYSRIHTACAGVLAFKAVHALMEGAGQSKQQATETVMNAIKKQVENN